MANKAKTTKSGTEQAVADNRIGVLVPDGTAERIRSLENTPMYWRGAVRDSQGNVRQVRAECKTRQGSLKLTTVTERAKIGTLRKPDPQRDNHFEGILGKETAARAWFAQTGMRGDKFTLRIVIGLDDGTYQKPERKQPEAVNLENELAALDATRGTENVVAETSDVPF